MFQRRIGYFLFRINDIVSVVVPVVINQIQDIDVRRRKDGGKLAYHVGDIPVYHQEPEG
jgi:hypothetical protein